MKFRQIIMPLSLFAGLLGGCSSGPGEWEDQRYAVRMEAADSVFNLGYIRQAQQHYAEALDRAFLTDDSQGIHDAGFNLATSDLRLKDYKASLVTLRRVSDALTVRGWTEVQQADLHLVRASVFDGQGQWQDAAAEARLARNSLDERIRFRAYALGGLASAAMSDRAGLDEAITYLAPSKDKKDQTDLKELLIWRMIMNQNWQLAADGAESLVKARREETDYEAMRRALRLEVRALQGMGQEQAAENVMRRLRDSDREQAKQ